MEIQNEISKAFLESFKGKVLETLCEGYLEEENCYYGRTYLDAPEVDGKVYFTADKKIQEGEFVFVKITDCTDYDLIGELI